AACEPLPHSILNYILVKLASSCNINCTYFYCFRDRSVYDTPKVLSLDVEESFHQKLNRHITRHRLSSFAILFHGGEPMLFGKQRFSDLCTKLVSLEQATGVAIRKSITTNGTLIDREWIELFRKFEISVTLSIDGDKEQHDSRRVDFKGQGTYVRVIHALNLLREHNHEPGILAVCDPVSNPERLCNIFIDQLGIKKFDVLIPDATYDDQITSIESYYAKLFDLWFDK